MLLGRYCIVAEAGVGSGLIDVAEYAIFGDSCCCVEDIEGVVGTRWDWE